MAGTPWTVPLTATNVSVPIRYIPNSAWRVCALVGSILPLVASACGSSPSQPSPAAAPAIPQTLHVSGRLTDTFTGATITAFVYNVCNGNKTSSDGTFGDDVRPGTCGWQFSNGSLLNGGLEIRREIAVDVEQNTLSNYVNAEIKAIARGTNFPIQLYKGVVPILDPGNHVQRPIATGFKVYAVANERAGQIRNAVGVIAELSEELSAVYAGLVADAPATPSDNSIYVLTQDFIPGGPNGLAGTTQFYYSSPGVINGAKVLVLPTVPENTIRHEIGRAVTGFAGNGAPARDSLFYVFGNPLHPSDDDRKAVTLSRARSVGSYLDETVDRDSR